MLKMRFQRQIRRKDRIVPKVIIVKVQMNEVDLS